MQADESRAKTDLATEIMSFKVHMEPVQMSSNTCYNCENRMVCNLKEHLLVCQSEFSNHLPKNSIKS